MASKGLCSDRVSCTLYCLPCTFTACMSLLPSDDKRLPCGVVGTVLAGRRFIGRCLACLTDCPTSPYFMKPASLPSNTPLPRCRQACLHYCCKLLCAIQLQPSALCCSVCACVLLHNATVMPTALTLLEGHTHALSDSSTCSKACMSVCVCLWLVGYCQGPI